MIFSNKAELYQYINENPNGYFHTLKSNNTGLYKEVKEKYTGTKNIGENFWLYCHEYSSPLTCDCGTKLLFENVIKGYKSTECKPCYNRNRKENGIIETKKKEESAKPLPKCENTKCNNLVTLTKNGTWSKYCSPTCRGQFNSLKSRAKSKLTMKSNHGVEHALQNIEIYNEMCNKIEEKNGRGIRNVMKIGTNKAKPVQTKIKLYGKSSSWSGVKEYQSHVDKAAEKYGRGAGIYTNVSQIPEVQAKKMKSGFLAKEYILPSGKIIRIQGYEDIFLDIALVRFPENLFDFEYNDSIIYNFSDKIRHYYPDFVLPLLNHIVEVKSDYTFYNDLEKNMSKAKGVVESGNKITFAVYRENKSSSYITFSLNRNIIKNSLDSNNIVYNELVEFDNYIVDFYLEEKKIAICYRSLEFTNELFLYENYYKDMSDYFNKNGTQLIVVNDLEISNKWANSLLSKCSLPSDRIYARKTEIKVVDSGAFDFLNKYHIQGFAPTSIKIGLIYDGEIVALMCFNGFRKGIGKDRGDGAYELVRYATSRNVIGGASKLLKYFVSNYKPKIIYSYSDNSISSGNMYKLLGFELEKELNSDYKYYRIGEYNLHHRFGFRKGALEEKLEFYDDRLSEKELMKLNGYFRVYDSGKKTWILQE